MRFTPENSVLLVIDVQSRLTRLMHEHESLLNNLTTLIKAAQLLTIPIMVTEQAPDKLGGTVPSLTDILNTKTIEKRTFSCCPGGGFSSRLSGLKRKQIVVCGIETHVCVYQTVRDLREQQFAVQVVADAVSSRAPTNKELALERIRLTGATLTSTEMIICEWIQGADHPKFREIMSLIK